MYDYRTPPKKRGTLQQRRTASASGAHRRGLGSTARHQKSLVRRLPSAPSAQVASQRRSFWSVLIGCGLLLLAGYVSYVLFFQMLLPNLLPVEQERVLVLSPTKSISTGQPITVIRISPGVRRMWVVSGVMPTGADGIPLSWRIGVPIDQVVPVSVNGQATTRSDISDALWQVIWSRSETGVPLRDALSWWLFSRSVPRANATFTQLETSDEWQSVRRSLTDGVATGTCQVAVVNTTGQAGLAGELSALLERSGFIVIKVGDTQELAEVTEVMVDESRPDCALEAGRVTAFIDVTDSSDLQPVYSTKAGLVGRYRTPIVITVGSNLVPALESWATATEATN